MWSPGGCTEPEAAAAAAAAAAAPEAEPATPTASPEQPQPRGRGRLPGSGAYTKKYLSVKRYRERKKTHMAQLEAEVVDKLAQVKLLMAENDVLQMRERVLQAVISEGEGQMRELEEEEARQDWRRAEAGRVVDRALSSGNSDSFAGRAASSCSGCFCSTANLSAAGELTSSESSGDAAAAELRPDPAASRARVAAFCRRYVALAAHLRARRLRRDGSVRPAPPGDLLASEAVDLLQAALAMPSEDAYTLLSINAETGVREAHPPDLHSRIARRLRLSPKQKDRVLAAWNAFEAALARLKADRSALLQALASMQQHLDGVPAPAAVPEAEFARAQAVETGISRVLQSADHEAIALALEDNMSRENQQWGIMTGTLGCLLEEHQLAHVIVLSHPYMVSLTQVLGAYVTEVLGHAIGPAGETPAGAAGAARRP